MKLELDPLDLKPEFTKDGDQGCNTAEVTFDHLSEAVQKAVLAVGRATFFSFDGETYNVIYAPVAVIEELSLADTIETGIHVLDCGGKGCPFHRWEKVTNPMGPGDSVCNLPGDGGNVISCYPNPYANQVPDIRGIATIMRLPKCLKAKPLSREEREALTPLQEEKYKEQLAR